MKKSDKEKSLWQNNTLSFSEYFSPHTVVVNLFFFFFNEKFVFHSKSARMLWNMAVLSKCMRTHFERY